MYTFFKNSMQDYKYVHIYIFLFWLIWILLFHIWLIKSYAFVPLVYQLSRFWKWFEEGLIQKSLHKKHKVSFIVLASTRNEGCRYSAHMNSGYGYIFNWTGFLFVTKSYLYYAGIFLQYSINLNSHKLEYKVLSTVVEKQRVFKTLQ